jgi:hypothetical protein
MEDIIQLFLPQTGPLLSKTVANSFQAPIENAETTDTFMQSLGMQGSVGMTGQPLGL